MDELTNEVFEWVIFDAKLFRLGKKVAKDSKKTGKKFMKFAGKIKWLAPGAPVDWNIIRLTLKHGYR